MSYYGTGPAARRAFLAANNIVRRDDDQYFRSHPNVPLPGHYPAPSEAELLSRSWREGDPRTARLCRRRSTRGRPGPTPAWSAGPR